MSSLCASAGLGLTDEGEELRNQELSPSRAAASSSSCQNEPAEVAWASDQDASSSPGFGDFPGMSN